MAQELGKEVLLVEDDRTSRAMMRALLTKMGYAVREAVTGQECLQYCEKSLPDLVLLDIVMPDIDGIEACRVLRQRHTKSELPIIMVTSRSAGTDLMEAFSVGANDYVTKPIDKFIFFARLEQQLRLSEAEQRLRAAAAELKETLRLQRAIGDVFPDGVLVERQSTQRIHFSNRVMRETWSVCEDEDFFDAFGRIAGGALLSHCAELRSSIRDVPVAECEVEVEFDDGGLKQRRKNFYLLTAPVDACLDLRLWLIRDVTALRKMEEKLQHQVKLETVRTLSGGIAHNFNNYLGAILGGIEILKRRTQGDEGVVSCLEAMEEAGAKAATLNAKLATALLPRTSRAEHIDAQTLRVIATEVLAKLCTESDSLELDMSFDEEVTFVLPRQVLVLILENLFTNAIDASARRVWLQSREGEREGYSLLKVEDDGCGMPTEVQRRAFDPFFSTKNLDKRNNVSIEGNGLGLWVVHSLVKALDGSIALRSVEGRGTVQVLQLPSRSNTIPLPKE